MLNNIFNDYEDKCYITNNPAIHEKFKNWIFNESQIHQKTEHEEMMAMQDNNNNNSNENKKNDVSKVSGDNLSIEKQNGKYNVVSKKILGSFETEKAAKKEIYNRTEADCHHHDHKFGEIN